MVESSQNNLDSSGKEAVEPDEQSELLKKYTAFAEWCKKNGIEYPNQEFPAFFNNGSLVGVRALKDI